MNTSGKTYVAVLSLGGMIHSLMSFKTLELAKTQADNWFNSREYDPAEDDVKVYEVEEGYSSSIGHEVYSGFYDEVA